MVYDGITEAFLCLSESKRCVSPCVAPTSSTKVFSSSLALVLLFLWRNRVSTLAQSRTRTRPLFCRWLCIFSMTKTTPFHPFVMLPDQSVAISIGYTILKRPIINIMLTKREIEAKSSAKTPPRPWPSRGVSVCNPTHILHLFLPPRTPIV